MATIRKNRQGEWTVSIQSLGFNTTFSTRTDKKTGANRLQRQIDVRVDAVKIDGSHPFHEWPRSEQLQWLKTGNEPKSATDAPIQLFEAVDRYLEHTKNQGKAISTTASYELELNAAKNYFGDIALVGLTGTKLQNWIDKLARTSNRSGRNRGKKPNPKSKPQSAQPTASQARQPEQPVSQSRPAWTGRGQPWPPRPPRSLGNPA